MTHKLVPFEHWHMRALHSIDSVDHIGADVLDDNICNYLENNTDSYTLFDGDGNIIACGGFMPQWSGRWLGWMYITPLTSDNMLLLTRIVNRMIEPIKGRIEITVREDFPAGHRWVKMLGFEIENPPGILKKFGPEGENHISYVRFN